MGRAPPQVLEGRPAAPWVVVDKVGTGPTDQGLDTEEDSLGSSGQQSTPFLSTNPPGTGSAGTEGLGRDRTSCAAPAKEQVRSLGAQKLVFGNHSHTSTSEYKCS